MSPLRQKIAHSVSYLIAAVSNTFFCIGFLPAKYSPFEAPKNDFSAVESIALSQILVGPAAPMLGAGVGSMLMGFKEKDNPTAKDDTLYTAAAGAVSGVVVALVIAFGNAHDGAAPNPHFELSGCLPSHNAGVVTPPMA